MDVIETTGQADLDGIGSFSPAGSLIAELWRQTRSPTFKRDIKLEGTLLKTLEEPLLGAVFTASPLLPFFLYLLRDSDYVHSASL